MLYRRTAAPRQRSPSRQLLTIHQMTPASIEIESPMPMAQKAVTKPPPLVSGRVEVSLVPRTIDAAGYMLRRYCPPTSNSAFVI